MPTLVWHRRDLRISDNHALRKASEEDEIIPIFIFDTEILEHGSPARVSFMLDSLSSLRDDYVEHGGNLIIEKGEPSEVLVSTWNELGGDKVVWNRDYSGLARKRDERVKSVLNDAGIEHETFKDAVLHEPDEIFTNAGKPYSVYSYYHKKWRTREKDDVFRKPDSLVKSKTNEVPTLEQLGFEEPEAEVANGGTENARLLLENFCFSGDSETPDIYRYAEERDYPALDATSGLSPHLKFGTIGVREVWEATEEAKERASTEDEVESVEEFQSQLAWRDFYTQVLYHNPNVVSRNYKEYENEIEWRDDEEEFEAWKRGETGYPIVDAGMRQLLREGFMHNRVRMIVASFLTKDLLIDWRKGYDWFRRKLVDHDTANDNGGWQWSASTGTDAQPYFRIFNPMTQGQRYDPECEYIKEYVPEVSEVSKEKIHSWHELSDQERDELVPEYPSPIIDHSKRREETLKTFEKARDENG